MPEFFNNRDPESFEVKNCLDHLYYVTLPVTPCNCNLIFMSLNDHDPKNYNYDWATKTFIMVSEAYLYENGPRADTIFLFDLTGATFKHALKPSISSIRKGMHFLESATPLNIKAVHLFNAMPFMTYIFGEMTFSSLWNR